MQTLLIILIILASILLAFFVLIQNPKGGGLASGFAGGSNVMGVKRTGDFLEKGTWTLIISIIVFSLFLNVLPSTSNSNSSGKSNLIESSEPAGSLFNDTAPVATPVETPANSDSVN